MLFPTPEEEKNPYDTDVSFLPEEILEKAVIHQDSGEYTWDYDTALKILDICEQKHIVVMGGDVWKASDLGLEPAYANWSINDEVNVDWSKNEVILVCDNDIACSTRSIDLAREYILNYPDPKDKTIWYSLGFFQGRMT